jgi:hypothetical protein
MQLSQWYLVANAARARLLSRTPDQPLQLVRVFGHVESVASSGQPADEGGAFAPTAGGMGGAPFELRAPAHEFGRNRFAHELARFIDHEAREGHFAEISVFAPSPFLGDLKHELGAATVHRLAAAEELDLTQASLAELERRVAATPGH